MAEILGLGCSHGPIILTPPKVWARGRERVFARIPDYQPPVKLLEELGQDNGLSQDKHDQQRVVESFKVLHDRLHAWTPDVLMIIGDDQAENFLPDNLPPFCVYTGAEVEGYTFQRPAARVNLWGVPPETKYTFRCPQAFARDLRNALIRDGFDLASSSALTGWKWGLAHAHINPLVFQVGTNHFAWEMASFEDLQAMYRHLKAKGVQILRTREHTPSVGVSCTAPDGNGLEVYDEAPGGYRQSWEGQYTRKLQAA
jgi:Glyoxalase/Bleomycin resistance protein/Dioxygenase superfamily